MTDLHVPKFLQERETQYFSEVKAVLWFVERMMVDNATFHVSFCRWAAYSTFQKWWRYCGLRAERFSTMQHSMFGRRNDIITSMFLQACITQCFSEVMALLWLSEWTSLNNATFHLWKVEWDLPKFTQVPAGQDHTVLLRRDGSAVFCGRQALASTMVYSTMAYKQVFCRCSPHSASHKWWQC